MKASNTFKDIFFSIRVLIIMTVVSSQFGWMAIRTSATPVYCCLNAGPLSVHPVISGNAGIGGATITYFGSPNSGSTIADSTGNYSFSVNLGWVGTVTPSLEGYTFKPAFMTYVNIQYDQPAQDYTATQVTEHLTYLPLVVR
jgi:hypothetical protein